MELKYNVWVDNAVVKNEAVVIYPYCLTPRPRNLGNDNIKPGEHGFGISAQKRFLNILDNYANMFESIESLNPSLFDLELKDKKYSRRPVFLTLTVPRQNGKSDLEIKKNCLESLLDNLKKNYNLKLYVWKAEPQKRGEIHFHTVVDTWLNHIKVRRAWFKLLKKNDCLAPGQTLDNSSRIVWLNVITNISSLKMELGGYFAASKNEDGSTKYKHDHSQTVREIEGNSWGCSDYLKYSPLSIFNLDSDDARMICANSLKVIPVLDKNGTERATYCKYKQMLKVGSGKNVKRFFKKNNLPDLLNQYKNLYHYRRGVAVYGNPDEADQIKNGNNYKLLEKKFELFKDEIEKK